MFAWCVPIRDGFASDDEICVPSSCPTFALFLWNVATLDLNFNVLAGNSYAGESAGGVPVHCIQVGVGEEWEVSNPGNQVEGPVPSDDLSPWRVIAHLVGTRVVRYRPLMFPINTRAKSFAPDGHLLCNGGC